MIAKVGKIRVIEDVDLSENSRTITIKNGCIAFVEFCVIKFDSSMVTGLPKGALPVYDKGLLENSEFIGKFEWLDY